MISALLVVLFYISLFGAFELAYWLGRNSVDDKPIPKQKEEKETLTCIETFLKENIK